MARIIPGRNVEDILDEVSSLSCQYRDAGDNKEKLEMNLNEWWRPALTVIGIEGLPLDIQTAGNVSYNYIKYRMSLRTPPDENLDTLAEKLRVAIMEAPE